MRESLPQPTEQESKRKQLVLGKILEHIESSTTIRLPDFSPDRPSESKDLAMFAVAMEPNEFNGSRGEFQYQFEGEDDLLHLMVLKKNGEAFPPETAQIIAAWLFEGIPPALIWIKPGVRSHHFYVGHDELITYLR